MALKHDIEKDVKRRIDHLKKQVDDLKKDVNQYSTENEEIRSRHQTHGMVLTRLQTGVSYCCIHIILKTNPVNNDLHLSQ